MIIVKNASLGKETVDALNSIIVQKVPVKTSYKLIGIIRKVNSLLSEVSKRRQELVNKHIERDEKGNPVLAMDNEGNIVPDRANIADKDKYREELVEFLNQEQVLDSPSMLDDDDLWFENRYNYRRRKEKLKRIINE